MEFIRKYIDAGILSSIITLPASLQNQKLEIIVLPAGEIEQTEKKVSDVDKTINALFGAIPDAHLSLEEYRAERRRKYEITD